MTARPALLVAALAVAGCQSAREVPAAPPPAATATGGAAAAPATGGAVGLAPPTVRFAVAFDHTALHVADLDRSIAFYERVFGLAEIEAPGDPAVIRWLSLGGDDQLHLIHYGDGLVEPTKAVHSALGVSDFDALVAHVRDLGVPYSDWPGVAGAVSLRPDGVRQVYVQDPDGYWIEVNDVFG